jgi:co-chaperonin GroES (HSP10)
MAARNREILNTVRKNISHIKENQQQIRRAIPRKVLNPNLKNIIHANFTLQVEYTEYDGRGISFGPSVYISLSYSSKLKEGDIVDVSQTRDNNKGERRIHAIKHGEQNLLSSSPAHSHKK